MLIILVIIQIKEIKNLNLIIRNKNDIINIYKRKIIRKNPIEDVQNGFDYYKNFWYNKIRH